MASFYILTMDATRLAALIERPEIQRRILNQYDGGYSIGLTARPENPSELAIRVRIAAPDASQIPTSLVLDGETVPILVHAGFTLPVPLKAH
jgi:hypothetical protein